MTAISVIGDCRLCGAVGVPLMDSHIMPKWAYRRTRDLTGAVGSPHPIQVKDGVAVQTSAQITEYMLCRGCEELLGRDENYVSKLAYQEDQTLGLAQYVREDAIFSRGLRMLAGVRTRAVAISHLDCQAIARFAASVFWRAHVVRTQKFDGLRLWKDQAEALSRFVRGERRLPDRMCLTLFVPVDGAFALTGVFSSTLFTPATAVKGEDSAHQFLVPGLVFNLTTGSHSIPELCLACGGSPHALIQHWRSIRVLQNAAEMIGAAEPKGRGARVARDL
jgi:hypothetical protein